MTYEQKLIDIALANPEVMIITAENRAAIRRIPDLIPQQFVDTGIAEQTMAGVAAGMALRGRVPVIHALASFLTMRAFEFIRTDIGIPSLPVKMVGAVPGFLSEANGPTHQAIEDISIMRGIPSVRIFCPSDENELTDALPSIIQDPYPYYIRFNNKHSGMKHSPFDIGKGEIIKEGEFNILTYGFLLYEAINAAEKLSSNGFSTGVVNMRMLKPYDDNLIKNILLDSKLVVVVEDHLENGGLYSIVLEEAAKNKIKQDIIPICLKTWFKPSLLKDVLEYEGFSGSCIADIILREYKANA